MIYPTKYLVSAVAKRCPEAVFYKETQQKIVALTIDDIPARNDNNDEATRAILTAIATQKSPIKATFFVITNHLANSTNILQEIQQQGHEIGNHGKIDHAHADLPDSQFQEEITQADQILTQATQTPISWFRPGQGRYNKDMLKTLQSLKGYQPKFALASLLPLDTYSPLSSPNFTLKYLKTFIFPGAVLILHGGTVKQAQNTAAVLKILLPYLHSNGYQVTSLSELYTR